LWLEQLGARIYDLLLGPPLGQARWADHLVEATGHLGAELPAQWEVDAELEASSGLGAGQCGHTIFSGGISIYAGGAARWPDRHHNH
jgi:hypothetical protein